MHSWEDALLCIKNCEIRRHIAAFFFFFLLVRTTVCTRFIFDLASRPYFVGLHFLLLFDFSLPRYERSCRKLIFYKKGKDLAATLLRRCLQMFRVYCWILLVAWRNVTQLDLALKIFNFRLCNNNAISIQTKIIQESQL